MRALTMGVIVIVAAAGWAFAEPTAEEKILHELYGEKIAKAKTSGDEADLLSVAKEMVQAASDEQNPPKLRLLLARNAMDLTVSLGTEDGVETARKGLKIADSIQPFSATEKAAFEKDLLSRQLARAQTEGKRPDQLAALGKMTAAAQLAYFNCLLADGADPSKLDGPLTSARTLVRNFRLTDLNDALAAAEKSFRLITTRRARLQSAQATLQLAKDSGNTAAIALASRRVADVYLECDGDLKAAAQFLAGTGDPREKAVTAAVAFLADPKSLDSKTALDNLTVLSKLAQSLADAPRQRVADCAWKMGEAYLAGKPPEMDAAKARILVMQLQGLLGDSPDEKLRRRLEAEYKGIAGKIQVISPSVVRVVYDFTSTKQLSDWNVRRGNWVVANSVLACQTKPWNDGEIGNKLRFRADRPVKISFLGTAKNQLMLRLSKDRPDYGHDLASRSFGLDRDKAQVSSDNDNWRDDKAKIQEGKAVHFEITLDGKGGYTWLLNGKLIRSYEAKSDEENQGEKQASYSIVLMTRNANRSPTAFDNLSIEGEPVVSGEPLSKDPPK